MLYQHVFRTISIEFCGTRILRDFVNFAGFCGICLKFMQNIRGLSFF